MQSKSDFIKMILSESGAVSEEEPAGLLWLDCRGRGRQKFLKNLIRDSDNKDELIKYILGV